MAAKRNALGGKKLNAWRADAPTPWLEFAPGAAEDSALTRRASLRAVRPCNSYPLEHETKSAERLDRFANDRLIKRAGSFTGATIPKAAIFGPSKLVLINKPG